MMQRVTDRLAGRLPFFYGYVMIAVSMTLQVTTSPGQTFAFSAFMPAFRESFSLSDSQLTLAYMLGTVLSAIPLMLIGPLSDRFGLRLLCITAVVALSATCVLASKASGWWSLLLTFFLLRFLGQGTLSLLGGNAIAMWFRSRIGRVSAIISIGTAIAFAWVPGLISESIENVGWRATYHWIAWWIVCLVLPLVAVLFCNRPEDIGQRVDQMSDRWVPGHTNNSDSNDTLTADDAERSMTPREARHTRAFWILVVTNAAWAMIGTAIVFYLFTICHERGFDSSVPSALFKTFGLSMLVGQLCGGLLADHCRLNRLLGVGVLMLWSGTGMLIAGESEGLLHGFSALFGGGQGTLLAVGSVIWVRYFGRKFLGTIRGTALCATVAGSGCGPLVMGLSHDFLGSFFPAMITFFVVLGVLTATAWWATEPTVESGLGHHDATGNL